MRALALPGMPDVLVDDRVEAMLASGCAVSLGVSGGKDSVATGLALAAALQALGHRGERVMIHSDLGSIEWDDSLPRCEALAAHLGWELIVARRRAGGMMERWEGRWANNVARYADLECLRLILPWSTPSMRFCTSELKTDVIESALKKRFRDHDVLCVTGLRRDESPGRARRPVSSPDAAMSRRGLVGATWNPILAWTREEVFATIAAAGLELHEAYRTWGSSRVSCSFCIMGSAADLAASSRCPANVARMLAIVDLEARSAFGFQGNRWLADVAPELLGDGLRGRIASAKVVAARREAAQAGLPASLAYDGRAWPARLPDRAEAEAVATARREVAEATGFALAHLTADAVTGRFAALMDAKAAKAATTARSKTP